VVSVEVVEDVEPVEVVEAVEPVITGGVVPSILDVYCWLAWTKVLTWFCKVVTLPLKSWISVFIFWNEAIDWYKYSIFSAFCIAKVKAFVGAVVVSYGVYDVPVPIVVPTAVPAIPVPVTVEVVNPSIVELLIITW